MTRLAPAVALVAIVSASSPALADDVHVHRYALVIGANDGGADRTELRYAGTDAESFADVVRDLGGVDTDDVVLLLDPRLDDVVNGFERVEAMIAADDDADRTELLVYYSGHSDERGLLLSGERYSYKQLRERVAAMSSDVNIVVLDSCASGAFTRRKGGTRRAPFLVDESTNVTGHAFLTSSSADEAAQESDRIGASFFTHFLVSGMRGAADANRDGRVTLGEAYQFAFGETVTRTESTAAGPQHPAYDIALVGTGDVVITDLRAVNAAMVLDKAVEGRVFVHDTAGRLVLELDKRPDAPVVLALAAEPYDVTLVDEDGSSTARVELSIAARTPLTAAAFTAIGTEPTIGRGGPPGAGVGLDADEDRERDYDYHHEVPVALQLVGTGNASHNLSLNVIVGGGNRLEGIEVGGIANMRNTVEGFQVAGIANVVGGRVEGIQLAGIANTAGGHVEGVQVAGIANTADAGFEGIQLAGIANVAGGPTEAIQIAGIASVSEGSLEGVQVSGIASVSEGSLEGFQVSGVASVAEGSAEGIQVSGIASVVDGNLEGFQVSGIASVTEGNVEGFQVSGIASVAEGDVEGVQVSLINVGGNVEGLQLGLINVASRLDGVQLGLINVSNEGDGAPIGLMSYARRGRTAFEVWTSDFAPLSAGVKLGSSRFYGVLTAASDDDMYMFGWGLGVHTPRPSYWIDVDLIGYSVYDHDFDDVDNDLAGSLRAMIGAPLLGPISVFGGIAVNGFVALDGKDGESMTFVKSATVESDDFTLRVSPGFFAGLSY